MIAHFRYQVNRNQGEHGNANQHHEHALDGKDITQFTDDGGKDSAGSKGQPHLVHKQGRQGIDEGAVEITAEVHQAEGDEGFPMDL